MENDCKCLKCEYEWISRIKDPKQCPHCRNRNWKQDFLKCEVCKRNFLLLHIHHKDGNHENNKEKNVMKICSDCHHNIHQGSGKHNCGLRGNWRTYKNKEIIDKIKRLKEYERR